MAVWDFVRQNPYVATLVAICVALAIAWWNNWKDRRVLSHNIQSSKILSLTDVEPHKSKLEVRYGGDIIEALWSHEIEVRNVGKKDLPGEELKKFTIQCGHALEVTLQNDVPDALVTPLSTGLFQVQFSLLKSGERLRISVLSAIGAPPSLSLRAKDFKVKTVGESSKADRFFELLPAANLLVAVAALLTAVMFMFSSYFDKRVDHFGTPANTVDKLDAVRNVLNLVYSRASRTGSVPSFDTKTIPAWAATELAIEEWNGPGSDLRAAVFLAKNEIWVSVHPNAAGKQLKDVRLKDPWLRISSRDPSFTYKQMDGLGGVSR